jgi:anti-anti-sigma factor
MVPEAHSRLQSSFRLSTQLDGTSATVRLIGEFDAGTSREFQAELDRITEMGARKLVLDLRGVTLVDSTALGLMLEAHSRFRKFDREFGLIAGPRPVQRVLEETGLDRMLPLIVEDA